MPAALSHVRAGAGKPVLLLHGLGGSWRSWTPIVNLLAAEREVIAVDLPGFGQTPPLPGKVSIAALADALTAFIAELGLVRVDVVGSSMGARLALELARRGVVGAAVALDPDGFSSGWQRRFAHISIRASRALARLLGPLMPLLTGNVVTRSAMRSFAAAGSFDPLLEELVGGPPPAAMTEPPRGPLVIGWGRQDRVCFPSQARRAQALFPHAKLVWFESCGHFPHWDVPQRTAQLILATTD